MAAIMRRLQYFATRVDHAIQIHHCVARRHEITGRLVERTMASCLSVVGEHATKIEHRRLGGETHCHNYRAGHIQRRLVAEQDGKVDHAVHEVLAGHRGVEASRMHPAPWSGVWFRIANTISKGSRCYTTCSIGNLLEEQRAEDEKKKYFHMERAMRMKIGKDTIEAARPYSEVLNLGQESFSLPKLLPYHLLLPRNTVSFSLDGTEEQVSRNYVDSLMHKKYWHAVNGDELDFQILCGIPQMLYTTPPLGTFHFILKRQCGSIGLITDARLGWLYAVACPKGLFVFKDDYGQYIQHTAAKVLRFKGDYEHIAPYGIPNLKVGVSALRDAFDILLQFDGSTNDLETREAFGVIVVHIFEAYKMHRVFALVCEAMSRGVTVRIGDSWDPYVKYMPQKWGRIGEFAARCLLLAALEGKFDHVPPRRLKQYMANAGIDSFLNLTQNVLFLTYQGVNHDLYERLPRTQFTMGAIDAGFGDPEVSLLNNLNPSEFTKVQWDKIQEENELFFGDRAGGLPHPAVSELITWPPSDAWIGRLPMNLGQKIPQHGRLFESQGDRRFWDRDFFSNNM